MTVTLSRHCPIFPYIFSHVNAGYTHLCGLEIILILSSHIHLDFQSSLLPSSLAINNINPFLVPKTLNRYWGAVWVNVGLGVVVCFQSEVATRTCKQQNATSCCFHKVILITRGRSPVRKADIRSCGASRAEGPEFVARWASCDTWK